MGIRSKMKEIIMRSGHFQKECASFLGYAPETLNSKMRDNKYSLIDLIKIGELTGNRLVYINSHDEVVAELTLEDLKEDSDRRTKQTKE